MTFALRLHAVARRLRSEEGGWALVTALVMMAIMMPVGLAVASYGDTRTKLSATERARESAFNLAEGVLSTEVYMLSHNWPGNSGVAYYANGCSSATPGANPPDECPDDSRLMANFQGADYASGTSWTATVSDNNGQSASFYSDSLAASQFKYDYNKDNSMWVRASATVRGVTRTLVAQAKVELIDTSLGFPRNAVTAGAASNSGQSNAGAIFVDTKGSAAQSSGFAVRCNTATSGCLGGQGLQNNVSPATITGNYNGGNAMTPATLDRFRQQAKSQGTWYSGCPSQSSIPKGPVVFIESGNCQINSSAFTAWNTAANPGMLITASGTLDILGTNNKVFYGIVYAANTQGSTGTVIHLQDKSVQGAVAVDGNGRFLVESQNSTTALTYDPNAFGQLLSFGNAGVVQNTFREVTAR